MRNVTEKTFKSRIGHLPYIFSILQDIAKTSRSRIRKWGQLMLPKIVEIDVDIEWNERSKMDRTEKSFKLQSFPM